MKVVLHTICRVRIATHLLVNAVLANTMGIAKGRTNVIGALLASFHKRADFQHLIEQQGYLLEFLPPYSPDLNPIEHKWAQAKALRRQKKCSIDELFTQLF